MTVESTCTKRIYEGNGNTRSFPVPFTFADASDVRLTLTDAAGRESAVTENFRVDVAASGDATVLYPLSGSPLAAGWRLTVWRDTPRTQTVDLLYGGAFSPEVIEEEGFDRAVMMIQELQESVDRAVKVPLSSDETPEALAADIFAARDTAVEKAAAASASEAQARAMAAQTADIKAAALREVREERDDALGKIDARADAHAARLDDLAANHVLTFEREIERGHQEADRARDEADRAEDAARLAADISTLAHGVENLEATWTLDAPVAAGELLELPFAYFPGRRALRLSWGGVALYPGAQFEEVEETFFAPEPSGCDCGEDCECGCRQEKEEESKALDGVSRHVRVLCDLPAGAQLNAWAVASNVAGAVREERERAEAAADAAQEALREAQTHADDARLDAVRAQDAADAAAASADAAHASENNAAASAADADEARRKAQWAAYLAQEGGLFTLRADAYAPGFDAARALTGAPERWWICDPSLFVPVLRALPIVSVDGMDDLPPVDSYVILAGALPGNPDDGQTGPGTGGGCECGQPGCGCGCGDDTNAFARTLCAAAGK